MLPADTISEKILTIRGKKVILASDLAEVYGVATKALNQAVKRNAAKFPPDFMFQITAEEAQSLRRSRSQFVTLKRGQNIKYLPHAFTEHGAIMAATVLNSPEAIQMSVFGVRAFIKMREALISRSELERRLHQRENVPQVLTGLREQHNFPIGITLKICYIKYPPLVEVSPGH